ncbi:MAG: hypothetical protein QF829_04310 [Candidatus Hydrothermarchaeota archaeon]|nr:hypothetical protein [Candidatus Hydrothermarchaeota archaeon]
MDLYCVLCGGRLHQEGEHVSCLGCDAEYNNVLLSETRIDNGERVITEMSLSMDFSKVTRKMEKAPLLQMTKLNAVKEVPV